MDPIPQHDYAPIIEDWLLLHSTSEQTERTYRSGIRAWLDWLGSHGINLPEATTQDTIAWIKHLSNGPNQQAPATIARKVATAASLHRYLVQDEITDRSPFQLVARPQVDPDIGGYEALTVPQVEALLGAADGAGARTNVAVSLLVHTAVRAAELLSVRVEALHDVDGEDGARHLAFWARRKGGKRDEVAVPDRVAHDVDALKGDRTHGYLITREGGDGPWSYWMLNEAVKKAGARAGIDKTVTPHMLRATWATTAIGHGEPLAWVQDVMGHRSPTTTRRYDRGARSITRKIRTTEAVAEVYQGGKGNVQGQA